MYSPLKACEALGCRIDYLATHDYRGEADKVMQRLELLHQRYGRKIWLTEFAKCCTKDENEVLDFVKVYHSPNLQTLTETLCPRIFRR